MAEMYDGTEGNDALAAGLPIMDGDEDWRDGWKAINRTRDEIARRTSDVTPIEKGGTGAMTPDAARASLGAAKVAHTHTINDLYGDDGTTPYGPWLGGQLNNLDTKANNATSVADNVANGVLNTTSYNRIITGSYRVAYLGSTGLLGYVPSSRVLKQDIEPADIDTAALLALTIVTFHYRADPDGPIQHGLIAEELHDLGLTWLVDYGDGDTPQGVRYDLLAVALLPAVQSAHARLDALEARLGADDA